MYVQISSSYVQRFMAYQQCTRFRTMQNLDREYLWNGASNRQADNGVIWTTIFFHVRWNNLVNFYPLTKNNLDLWPWNSTGFVRLSKYMFGQNFIKLSAAVHAVILSTSVFALSRNGEKSDNPVLWPWPLTLIFSGFRAVVKGHVQAKFQSFTKLRATVYELSY